VRPVNIMHLHGFEIFRIGTLIPAVLVIAFAVDVLARFFPIDALTFRSWEALIRYPAPCGLFRPNAVYENRSSYGDLASVGNYPEHRVYRHEIFSTDNLGYRRNPQSAEPQLPYKILTVGDSFAFGLGLNDHETVAAQLERSLGVGVYNGAAGTKPATINEILRVARLLNLTKATVLYEYYQEHDLPERAYLFDKSESNAHLSCATWQNRVKIWYRGFTGVSPLKVLAQQTIKRLHNDKVIPNPMKSEIVVRTLTNGDPILFSPGDIRMSRMQRAVDIGGLKALADHLRRHDLKLTVLLVPTKYTVYRPLLQDDDSSMDNGAIYLDRLENALRAANILTINLLPRFREAASEAYREREYIYWRDDMHWNASAVAAAVEEIGKEADALLDVGEPARVSQVGWR